MLWGIEDLINYVSKFFTIKKGYIIFTGTTKGVGKIQPNDYLSGSLKKEEMITVNIK